MTRITDNGQSLGFEEAKAAIRKTLRQWAEAPAFADQYPVILRVEIPLARPFPSLLNFLSFQTSHVKLFWKERSASMAVAGVGVAWEDYEKTWGENEEIWSTLAGILQTESAVRVFAGMAFHRAVSGEEWRSFKSIRFVIPRFEIVENGGQLVLACNVVLGRGDRLPLKYILKDLEALTLCEPVSGSRFSVVERWNLPNYEHWKQSVLKVLDEIRSEKLSKVVLSRRVTVALDRAVDPCFLLSALMDRPGPTYAFLFQFAPDHAFIGVSPEQLYFRSGDQVKSEAIAGTRPRGSSDAEDQEFRHQLLESAKERREHRFVVTSLVDAFRQVCQYYTLDEGGEILELPRHQHLITRISGRLAPESTDRELCATLHPTPAVGGVPVEQALSHIHSAEDFDRGWFAGPVGCFSRSSVELAVAIRSCLVEKEKMHIYSGAGIVEGSDPLAEWEELEQKIRQYLELLYGR